MTSTPHLNGHHRKALASLFRHPASHNVEWHDVLSLLQHVGTVTERHNGTFDVTIGDHEIVLDRPKGHDLEGDQVRAVKAFLTLTGLSPEDGAPPTQTDATDNESDGTCIVLIDHHQARLFEVGDKRHRTMAPIVLVPADPDGSRRRLDHREGNDERDGGHSSEDTGYYERICDDLTRATRIVLLSDGQGRSSAGEQLVDYLKRHHAGIADRIVATDRVDMSHLSDGEIVAAGRALLAA